MPDTPTATARDATADTAVLIGRLTGLVNMLPRDEFGERYALAVTAAYRRVEALLIAEMERVICGREEAPDG